LSFSSVLINYPGLELDVLQFLAVEFSFIIDDFKAHVNVEFVVLGGYRIMERYS
jgi:hypothetical protein